MEKKDTSAFYKNSHTCEKVKTTLTKKDDYSITIETQYEHTIVHDERINQMPTSKSDISSKVVRWFVCIVRLLLA